MVLKIPRPTNHVKPPHIRVSKRDSFHLQQHLDILNSALSAHLDNHAMKPVTANPTIYPVYCHDISPTIGKWCPLRAADVHKLRSVGMVLDGILLPSLSAILEEIARAKISFYF